MSQARRVIDYISWMEHVAWVRSMCDSAMTAAAMFDTFQRSASAERGRPSNLVVEATK